MQPFHERHGLRGAMVAPTKIIAGLGLSLGLELLACPGATGDYRSDFGAKVRLFQTQAGAAHGNRASMHDFVPGQSTSSCDFMSASNACTTYKCQASTAAGGAEIAGTTQHVDIVHVRQPPSRRHSRHGAATSASCM